MVPSEEDEELPLLSKHHRTDTTIPVPTGRTSSYWPSNRETHHLFGPSTSSIRGNSNVGGSNQSITKTNGVDLFDDKELVVPVWEGQPKGQMQVLWEGGLMDTSSLVQYTVDGKKTFITGHINLHSSLRHILTNFKDFQEEETALEHLGTQLGITVKLTPKFHAKLAGEGAQSTAGHIRNLSM